MRQIKSLVIFAILFALYSCNDDDPQPQQQNCSTCTNNIVEITEDVDVNTTWYADSIYVIKAWDFYVNATLVIQPGTIIKFTNTGNFMGTSGSGTIVAEGTNSDPIIFTSIKDDNHGGDINGDGNATSPAPRDWSEILVQTNGCTFRNCYFLYGGYGSSLSTLNIYDVNATIDNCTFAYNHGGKSGAFYYGALDATNARENTVITNNVFHNNVIPLSVESVIQMDNSNSFHNPVMLSEINEMNGIFIYSYDDFYKAVYWSETEVPFVINDNDLWIETGASLNLADNVVLKFTPTSAIVIGIGAVLNQNSTNAFTSFKDDSKLGDTNGDGDATYAQQGDWQGIYSDDLSAYLNWSNISYDNN
jgi:hypothetical protein